MKHLYTLGVFLGTPLITLAHDGEHVVTLWYRQPVVIVMLVVAVAALGMLVYGWTRKDKQLMLLPALALVALAVAGTASLAQRANDDSQLVATDFGSGRSVTLYKSPNCGCCSGHARALEQAGFEVTIELTDDLAAVKQAHNIPAAGESCHTSVIGEYVVEGHVPLEAIERLVTEAPDIAGIGLSGMPIGTPGMPGPKIAPYEVYQLAEDGKMLPYMTI